MVILETERFIWSSPPTFQSQFTLHGGAWQCRHGNFRIIEPLAGLPPKFANPAPRQGRRSRRRSSPGKEEVGRLPGDDPRPPDTGPGNSRIRPEVVMRIHRQVRPGPADTGLRAWRGKPPGGRKPPLVEGGRWRPPPRRRGTDGWRSRKGRLAGPGQPTPLLAFKPRTRYNGGAG